MAPTLNLLLLINMLGFAFGLHNHLHEDHSNGHDHSPDHNLNVLLGDENTEEIKKLTPTEQGRKLLEIVEKIDTNKDNLLSQDEIIIWIQQIDRKYALEDAEELFPKYDMNKDGVVTWEEYNTVDHDQFFSFDENTFLDDPEQESLRQLYMREKRKFEFADSDNSSALNIMEFLAFKYPSEVEYMNDFALEEVLTNFDTDKDDFISLKEYIGDVRGEDDSPSKWEIEETIRFKELFDQDKDGKLNRDEQLRWIVPNSYSPAREEALHLIKEVDQDGDMKISIEEVLKNQETLMNSEVTDYGRQLHTTHDEL